MRLVKSLRLRLRALFARSAIDADLSDEIRFHLDQEAEKYVNAGMTPDEARSRARAAFGNVETAREEHRDAFGVRWIRDFAADARYAVRTLRHTPVLAAAAIITIALGIGANTAIFSVVNGVLLRPLPFKDPGQLTVLWETRPGRPETSVSAGEFQAWEQQTSAFNGMSALDWELADLTGTDEPVQTPIGYVSTNFFNLLGVQPIAGSVGILIQNTPETPGPQGAISLIGNEVFACVTG
ncbi:MAG: permease prefix domain 1-containing protein, partial [Gemmatimonadaceae bacterium]